MKNKLVGFALNCGNNNRIIYLYEDETYEIGCFKGTYKKSLKAIKEKYSEENDAKAYINKLDQCKNMSWLTEEKELEMLKSDSNDDRLTIAKYSDKYHHILAYGEDPDVRKEVAKYNKNH